VILVDPAQAARARRLCLSLCVLCMRWRRLDAGTIFPAPCVRRATPDNKRLVLAGPGPSGAA
jgi:hypothetical protein